ncbi:hypothetical protein CEXT_30411 [Caerostris extrusa]|uniref:Uncharacterized protein n=1 Tax=Caerostris extrusa TaxID=172846 RepID=A0AAV4QLS6_CAEEX|nr:hypothetical protein CEXT_30411 [Caerostris extrusa]
MRHLDLPSSRGPQAGPRINSYLRFEKKGDRTRLFYLRPHLFLMASEGRKKEPGVTLVETGYVLCIPALDNLLRTTSSQQPHAGPRPSS